MWSNFRAGYTRFADRVIKAPFQSIILYRDAAANLDLYNTTLAAYLQGSGPVYDAIKAMLPSVSSQGRGKDSDVKDYFLRTFHQRPTPLTELELQQVSKAWETNIHIYRVAKEFRDFGTEGIFVFLPTTFITA